MMSDASLLASYEAARTRAVVFDHSGNGKVEAIGPEAARFLHNLCTNEIVKLPIGSCCEAFFTTHKAKILVYARIWRQRDDAFLLDVGDGQGPKLFEHLNRHLISERVELADRTEDFLQIHLTGPKAHEIVTRNFLGAAQLAELPPVEVQYADSQLIVRRNNLLGMPGFDLLAPPSLKPALEQALEVGGATHGDDRLFDILRLETGLPIYGVDFNETNLPQEVNRIEQTISFTKGCYVGQEPIARIHALGHVNRQLVGLKFLGDQVPLPGSGLAEAGYVTSAAHSPQVGPIGLGYVRKGFEAPGTRFTVSNADFAAEVAALPFVPNIVGN